MTRRRAAAVSCTIAGVLALVWWFQTRDPAGSGSTDAGSVERAQKKTPRGVRWGRSSLDDAAAAAGADLPDDGAIRGRVVDAADGTAVEGASITLRTREGEVLQAADSRAGGEFEFPAAAEGARVLAATAPGYSFHSEPLRTEAGSGVRLISLDAAVRVRGLVVDGGGKAVAGAEVWVEDGEGDDWDRWPRPASDVAITGADGTFAIADAPSGHLVVYAKTDTKGRGEEDLGGVGPGRERTAVRVQLVSGIAVAGRVVDENGTPIARASIKSLLDRGNSEGPSVETDVTGAFRLQGIPAGFLVLTATDDSGGEGVLTQNVRETDVLDLKILIERGVDLSGRVQDPDGTPILGASVRVTDPKAEAEGEFSRDVSVSESGTFEFRGLPPGKSLQISAAARGYRDARPITVAVGTHGIVLTLKNGAILEGTVVLPTGALFPGKGTAIAFHRERGRSRRNGVPLKAGAFRFDGLEDGDWEVSADVPGFNPTAKIMVSVAGETKLAPVKLVLGEQGRVTGRLVSRDGGPVAGARVSVSRPRETRLPDEESVRLDWGAEVRSDPRGGFSLSAGAGPNQLFVYHPEFHAEVVRAEVPIAGTIDVGEIELRAGEGTSAIFEFSGIGAVLSREEGGIAVRSVLPGSPAERAGIRAKDGVISIDGAPTAPMDMEEVVTRIRGPVGTTVSLLLARPGNPEPLHIDVIREKVRT